MKQEKKRLPGQPDGLLWALLPSLMESVVAPMFRAWGATWRMKATGVEHLREVQRNRKPMILATWHGSMAGIIYTLRDRRFVGLVSPVYEGELIARFVRGMGFKLVRGSNGYQPAEGLRASVRVLKNGQDVATVVDGPEGPAMKVKQGVIAMARLAGAPILPALTASNRAYHFPNWDRHELPLPYSRVRVGFGKPLTIPRDAKEGEIEHYQTVLEEKLLELDSRLRHDLGGRAP